MNLRQLRYFIAVAEELHFGRAAERLHVSQPPITRQIQALEEQLGAQLFNRTPRGVELTQAGALFLDEARNIVGLLDQAADRVHRASEGGLGRLDIAIFGTAILSFIPRIILEFKRRYPDVKVVMHALNKTAQIEALQNRSIDLGFNRMLTPVPGLAIEELASEPLFAVVPDPGPFAERSSMHLSELSHEPMLLFPASRAQGFVEKVTGLCHEAGFAPNVAQVVGDGFTAMALVAAGFGVCLVPGSITSVSMEGVKCIPLEGMDKSARVDISCIYRETDPSPILANFLEVARGLTH
ncbi:LysR family transcriptional regulator [Thioclava pacifica]|uniref:HTH lysR-type domain-containing protein n=1 Tax=Thioclava pacifica DSM 10166 TaxID=1353537 RepID=A0A074JK04_9RHOB|nr:LysR family transcriptional regulator [Thioclava pacifica]KEO56190.1 hypothetical protein TP2_01325 [Thioclava pacifica DSM 10166]